MIGQAHAVDIHPNERWDFIHENACSRWNVVSQMATILSRPQYVDMDNGYAIDKCHKSISSKHYTVCMSCCNYQLLMNCIMQNVAIDIYTVCAVYQVGHQGPFYWHGFLIPAFMINYILSKVCDEITYPFINLNGCTVEWKMDNCTVGITKYFHPHSIMDVMTYPCWDWSQSMLVEEAPGERTPLALLATSTTTVVDFTNIV